MKLFQWHFSLYLIPLAFLLPISNAQARVQCSSANMTPLTFSAVDAQSTQTDAMATFSIRCENTLLLQTRSATICVSIGPDRQMKRGSDTLNFQLYQDPSHSIVWGSQFSGASGTPLKFNVTLGPRESKTFPATLYGRVLGGQVAVIPGPYTKSYPNSSDDARVTVNAPIDNDAPGTCNTNPTGSLYIPFTVEALKIKSCQVTTTGDLNFGRVLSGSPATAISSPNLINVTCTNGTPYNIGLSPSNGNVEGMGVMKNSAATNTIPYQLQSNASGKAWGNKNVTSTNVGNGVAGIGTGIAKGETVFATVGNTDVKPDTYSDTVTVHVNY